MTVNFSDFALRPELIASLEKNGYKQPTGIQKEAIPLFLEGHDLIALAKTGSGKTAACAIPVCSKVDLENKKPQALVIVPTRELAYQYATETQKIGGKMGVKTFAICGGEDPGLQRAKLTNGVHVLVATPGRLIDFIYSRDVDLSEVSTLILDEADEMLNMGFYEDLEFIMQCLFHEHQTCLFSATMPKEIKKIALQHMKNPKEIKLTEQEIAPAKIDHRFVYTRADERDSKLADLLHEMNPTQCIIFCRSRVQVEKVTQYLKKKLHQVDYLHAGLSQDVRTIITNKVRSGKIRYLVATDVAARGLDFSRVSHVFIYELNKDSETYIHRSGRTGRQEREGQVISLVTHRELWALKKISEHLKEEPKCIGTPPPSEPPHKPKHPR
ncbi:MAG: DEAD/DEAH box helicase, partial [Chlamydiia bacterium]|nr:DEAD/DEAH box helicase [Chlamydiia bacterium]